MNLHEGKPFTSLGPRIRKSPFFNATRKAGYHTYTIYNHMYMPIVYETPEIDYWNLINNVTIWDVAAERQVEMAGPDAFRLAQYICPRDLSKCQLGQGMYVPLVTEEGGMINDPVLLRLAEDRFWLSLADSDILLWAKGIAMAKGWDVNVFEPDASPLAIQGPKAKPLVANLFGDWVLALKYFWFKETELDGIPMVLARSGWSKQGGFELYLTDRTRGEELWNKIMEAGKPYHIAPAAPNQIERIESGLLSHGSDMDMRDNPFEVNLGKFIDTETEADYIGKSALQKIKAEGIKRKQVGLKWNDQSPSNENHLAVFKGDKRVGKLTSSAYSPRLKHSIALALLDIDQTEIGNVVSIESANGRLDAEVSKIPFLKASI